jgi:hypothetical protein
MDNSISPLNLLTFLIFIGVGGVLGGCAQVLAKITLWHDRGGNPEIPSDGQRVASLTSSSLIAISNTIDTRAVIPGRALVARSRTFAFQDESLVHLTFGGFIGLITGNALLGIAGAAGTVGIFALIKILDSPLLGTTTPGEQTHLELVILGISVIGGFIARRLLPILGENLVYRVNENERKLAEQDRETGRKLAQQNKEIEKTQAEAVKREQQLNELLTQRESDLSQAIEEKQRAIEKLTDEHLIDRAFLTLQSDSVERWGRSRIEIANYHKSHPDNREATILAARFAVERLPTDTTPPDFNAAINILTDYLQTENISDINFGDVIYNRACYFSKLAEMADNEVEKREYIKKAIADLEKSIARKAANKEEAAKDEWLMCISRTTEFAELIAPLAYEAKELARNAPQRPTA